MKIYVYSLQAVSLKTKLNHLKDPERRVIVKQGVQYSIETEKLEIKSKRSSLENIRKNG
jgi:hypothetical protein